MNKLKIMGVVGTLAGDDAYVGGNDKIIELEALYEETLKDEKLVRD